MRIRLSTCIAHIRHFALDMALKRRGKPESKGSEPTATYIGVLICDTTHLQHDIYLGHGKESEAVYTLVAYSLSRQTDRHSFVCARLPSQIQTEGEIISLRYIFELVPTFV